MDVIIENIIMTVFIFVIAVGILVALSLLVIFTLSTRSKLNETLRPLMSNLQAFLLGLACVPAVLVALFMGGVFFPLLGLLPSPKRKRDETSQSFINLVKKYFSYLEEADFATKIAGHGYDLDERLELPWRLRTPGSIGVCYAKEPINISVIWWDIERQVVVYLWHSNSKSVEHLDGVEHTFGHQNPYELEDVADFLSAQMGRNQPVFPKQFGDFNDTLLQEYANLLGFKFTDLLSAWAQRYAPHAMLADYNQGQTDSAAQAISASFNALVKLLSAPEKLNLYIWEKKAADWETSYDFHRMLETVRNHISERKLRLISCAFWRLLGGGLKPGKRFGFPYDYINIALETTEQYVDGLATQEELRQAHDDLATASFSTSYLMEVDPSAVKTASSHDPWEMAQRIHFFCRSPMATGPDITDYEFICNILREIYYNPAKTLPELQVSSGNQNDQLQIDPAWRTQKVVRMAQNIYDTYSFEQLPKLADALVQAGCPVDEVIEHFRQPVNRTIGRMHVRGCWALDWLLGKS